ncbi:hypothetical protein WHZ78_15605 [Bradyrhizobium symbiodeficiens]|uniref:hypothetical protein n=1 Tax=Bradyrhizobium symbiodeficiens TaxID=1404367 RepID=UPI0030D3DF45
MKKPSKSITYRMLPKNLAALRASPEAAVRPAEEHGRTNEIFWPNDSFELRDDEAGGADGHPEAIRCVVAAAFEAATTPAVRRRLHHSQALAAVVLVPSPFWVAPTSGHFGEVFGDRWRLIRPLSVVAERRPTNAEMVVAAELSSGQSVAGVSADVSALPRSLVLSADMTIRIFPPPAAVLCAAIRRFAGRAVSEDLLETCDPNLDLPEIVACFRPGSGAPRIAQRLAIASALGRTDPGLQNFIANPAAVAGANQKETQ